MAFDPERLQILDAFQLPQLARDRAIRLYLPRDYHTTLRRYPVIYMQDGQNVFDDATASYGRSWRVGETLDALHEQSGQGAIVVAIDCGEDLRRFNEYSPWQMDAQFALPGRDIQGLHASGGEGEAYVRFLAETLKPYIDQHYRTLSDRQHTVIAGSSMGGYISLYAGMTRPAVFGVLGVFSPAFWFNRQAMFDLVERTTLVCPMRIYMDMGSDETSDHTRSDFAQVYLQGSRDMHALLQNKNNLEVEYIEGAGHQHNELAWSLRFPHFARWALSAEKA